MVVLSQDRPATTKEIGLAVHRPVEALIASLRSRNKDPNPKMDWPGHYPEDYDFHAQQDVDRAIAELERLGKTAFPALIDHVNDKEYSRSMLSSLLRSMSVGETCFMIIESQIESVPGASGYKVRFGTDGQTHAHKGYFSKYCDGKWYTQDGLRKWYREHRDSSLREMRIDAVKWTIAREREIGFLDERDRESYLYPLERQLAEFSKK